MSPATGTPKTIHVLRTMPDDTHEWRDITRDLPTLQAQVGGYIESINLPTPGQVAFCNEEGKIDRLPVNYLAIAVAMALGLRTGDFLVGPVFFCGQRGSSTTDAPQAVHDALQRVLDAELHMVLRARIGGAAS